jgi:hypothetical protein
VVSVSIAPLLSIQGWQGPGSTGAYSCTCGQYFVRFSDAAVGGDKPHVYTSYNGFQVDVIEVSDDESSVNGLNMYSNFTARPDLEGGGLAVSYSSPQLNFTKTVSVGDGSVHVSYSFGRNVTALITLWRWYYTSIGAYDLPVTRDINTTGGINYTFFEQGAVFNGSVVASPTPVQAQISGIQGAGLNKISLTFNASKIDLTVVLRSVKALAGVGVLQAGASNYAYPIIGVGLATAYLVVRRELGGRKN